MTKVKLVAADKSGAVELDPEKERGEYLQALARGLKPVEEAPKAEHRAEHRAEHHAEHGHDGKKDEK